uniref:SERTA domain-containing protein n=1 Tax=Anabas testudineus TaxID=64144 RepID=A0A3Q1IYH7_ANATE
MLGRGVKRKWSCLEELEAEEVPAAQRQRVLGLCLEKLQRYQAGMELSLRRSVLLINTLRQIQEDMRSDGAGACTADVLLNGVHPDSCLLRDDFREDMSVTCPGCAEDDGASLSLSPPLSPEFPSQEENVLPDQQKSLPASTISSFSDAVNAMGYLSDLALDDIFEDIDTSMYETSDLPSLRSPTHSSPASLQSCLMDLNELDHIMEILVKS